jgi:hypothetical protein
MLIDTQVYERSCPNNENRLPLISFVQLLEGKMTVVEFGHFVLTIAILLVAVHGLGYLAERL